VSNHHVSSGSYHLIEHGDGEALYYVKT